VREVLRKAGKTTEPFRRPRSEDADAVLRWMVAFFLSQWYMSPRRLACRKSIPQIMDDMSESGILPSFPQS
jgi:hypothetical protein